MLVGFFGALALLLDNWT